MRKYLSIALALAALGVIGGAAIAADDTATAPAVYTAKEPNHYSWSFQGPFGTFDRSALQRGYQVYKEVCSNCHSMKYVAFRDLEAIGFTEPEIKALAAQYSYQDGPNDKGEMYDRPGTPADHFKPPFPNEQAARAANGGGLPPDLSLMAYARPHGPDYIRSLITGFTDPPKGVTLPAGKYYNPYFGNTKEHAISMPPPLSDGQVTYADGTKATVDQMASDVVTFLSWTADPTLEERHNIGFKVIVFLVILVGLFYAVKRRVWADVH
jgi:ubiquinol-cytochrome c reductase cytochrome c1 subunit